MENNEIVLESTDCILYVRDPSIKNPTEIVKVLEDVIHQIKEGTCTIKVKSFKEGSLIIHVVVSEGLPGINSLKNELTLLFNSIFELDYINKNFGPNLDVVLAESDYTIIEGKVRLQTATPSHKHKVRHDMASKNDQLLLDAGNGDNKSVEECLANGANVNCTDNDGLTPLHWAAQNGHKATVYLLISKAAAISNKDKQGLTPLHCAAGGYGYKRLDHFKNRGTQEDHIAIVDYLISMGSVIDSKDAHGRTPYDLASFDEMKKRLKDALAGINEGLPLELIHLDKESVNEFKQLLKEDSYQLFELRSMLQGEQGTGKSTIARFLVGMRPTLFRKSTDGIDLYTGLCFFDNESNIWLGGKQDFTLEDIIVSRTIKDLKKPTIANRTKIEMTQQNEAESTGKTEGDISKKQELSPQSESKQKRTEPTQRENPLAETNVKQDQMSLQDVDISNVKQEQASLLTHADDNSTIIKNPGIIQRLKDFFGIKKEVKEVKISEIYAKSRKVATKEFHKRTIVPVTIWDFGGQDVFYSTHQTFLTYRAVYMLILDGSRTLDAPCNHEVFLPGKDGAKAKTQEDYVRFWINTIITYCKGETPGFPKIMVILTHKDKLKESEIEKRRDEIFGKIGKMFNEQIKQHLAIEDKIFVNARNNNDPEMEKIKLSLIQQAKRLPRWGENLPKCFLPLELEIQYLVNKGIAIITIEDMKKINDRQAVRPLTDSELKTFLKFQHSVGKILYFDEPYLDKHIIISPTFLIDAFKSIITDKQFCKGDKQKEEAWYSMDKKGIILKQAVETIWKQKKYIHFYNSRIHLLGVMTHLDIVVEPRRYDTNHCRIPTEFYYVASMVRKQDTTEYLDSETFSQRNIAISFVPSSSMIPPALSFRFISYCLSIWGVKTYNNEEMLFHRSAVFTVDSSLDLHIQCDDEQLFVRLVHAKSRTLIIRDLASSIRECLSEALHKISQLYIRSSSEIMLPNTRSFDVKVCCSASKKPCFIGIQDIGDVWRCSHQIEHGKDLVLSWFREKRKESCDFSCPVTDQNFLLQTPTDLHLRRLALEYDLIKVKTLVIALGLRYSVWDELYTSSLTHESIKFTALKRCSEKTAFTYKDLKIAVEKENIQNPHIICKVVRDEHISFDTDPEKWDLTATDEDIDKLSTVVGNRSLGFLVELGLTFLDWENIQHSQRELNLVKLNRTIMELWRTNCKIHNIKPTLRTIGQAFENIEINIKTIELLLFN